MTIQDPITDLDRRLADWMQSVLPAGQVSFRPPGRGDDRSLGIHPYALDDGSREQRAADVELTFTVRYLVHVDPEADATAREGLLCIAVASREHPSFEVDLTPLPAAAWTAFAVPPRPALVLHAPLRIHRPRHRPSPVLHPLELERASMRPLRGIVLGPGDVPLADARVALPDTGRVTRTDARGRFTLPAVPADTPVLRLRLRAKGRDVAVDVTGRVEGDEPLVLRCNDLET